MFEPGSRYEKMPTYTVTLPDGRTVTAVRLPLPLADPLLGYHRRLEGQRLDHIAARYLRDATTFWRLCDVSGVMVPDALAARDLVGVPQKK
ncbi:MAG TPA: hypothetical protein VFE68_04045 [Vicinamibacteria bacterium]|jgi:hypothetical protein|nr:hypothetical protein [Vicinamibacteria bacterium]